MNKSDKNSDRGIQDIQAILRDYLKKIIRSEDVVVDATTGLGRDTLFLAQCVGPKGKVFAFDIQKEAIEATRELLTKHKMSQRVELLQASHVEILNYVPKGIKAVVFNLGYLPNSNHRVKTLPETTVRAIGEVLDLLAYKGIVAVTAYRGHEGGLEESNALIQYISGLPKKEFSVLQGIYLNQGENSPYWIMIQKTGRIIHENPPSEENPGANYK